MSRSLGIFAAAVVVFCASAAAAAPPDDVLRVRALERLLGAASVHDGAAMWEVLSRVSRRRLGPTFADFRRRGSTRVRASVASFAGREYTVVGNIPLRRGLGLVAVARGAEAFATPVRRERGTWKVEHDPAFTIEPVRPLPGERVVRRTQLAAEVVAPGRIDGAGMWLDGVPFEARLYWSPNERRMSMWGEAPQPLRSGRHVVVAFASAGSTSAATAWTFTVRGRGSGSRLPARMSP